MEGQFINTTIVKYNLPTAVINQSWAISELLKVEVCSAFRGGREIRFYHSSPTRNSSFVREIGGINESVTFLYKGSGEIHVNNPLNVSIGDINVSANINQTYFDEQFNQTWNNQQTIYSFIQAMNTTIVTNQNYIISLVQNVSTQITNSWQEFWDKIGRAHV